MIRQLSREDVLVPAHCEHKEAYIDTYLRVTRGTGNLMLFAGDQKIEHLNEDFKGDGITEENAHPEHLFKIAQESDVGVFAAQHGLISRYAHRYPRIRYLVKVNSKTHLVPTKQADPISQSLVDFQDVLDLKSHGVDVVGVGYTVYLGSEHEHQMLAEAGRLVSQAHKHGLLAVIWMYPRGEAISNETSPDLIAGAAGVACSLGADFVKVSAPKTTEKGALPEYLVDAVQAAGATGIITSGGSKTTPEEFIKQTHEQIHLAGTRGSATGRNIHQLPLPQAIALSKALQAVVLEGVSYADAAQTYKKAASHSNE